jgi:hypothetical protein
MTPLRAKMIYHMQLQCLAPSTQDVYLRAVAGLAAYYNPTATFAEHALLQQRFTGA